MPKHLQRQHVQNNMQITSLNDSAKWTQMIMIIKMINK